MNDIVMTLNKKIDRTTINADTSIEYVNNYASDLAGSQVFKYSDLSTDEKESLNVVLDKLSFTAESSAIVFNVNRTAKTFDLSDSYVRDAQSTETPLTAVTDGQSLLVRFEVPGFTVNTVREISLFYNEDFLTTDLDDLAEIGITITGNGESFTIDNDRECRVTFLKPELVVDDYIINDVNASQTIEV
jgi:hypothetical protein